MNYFIELINNAKNSNAKILNLNPENARYEITETQRKRSHKAALNKYLEMVEFIGEDPLTYMKKYP